MLALLLANLPGIIKLLADGYSYIVSERSRLQQTGEWTAEQEAQFQALEAQRATSPWHQPQG